jgi:hypothetical protein
VWHAAVRQACGGAQVMEEGERLSKKQLAQENTIKKLRSQLEEMRSEKGATAGTLAAERAKVCCLQFLYDWPNYNSNCIPQVTCVSSSPIFV